MDNLEVYRLAMDLGEKVWNTVPAWNKYEKNTVGIQLIRSVDSIGANISEGMGRYHFNDQRRFYYIARGSLFESKTWLTKAFNRKLISEKKFNELVFIFEILHKKLNSFIKSVGRNLH